SSRRRHTRFSRDWSSDVCSSDLFADRIKEISTTTGTGDFTLAGPVARFFAFSSALQVGDFVPYLIEHQTTTEFEFGFGQYSAPKIGRASCRERASASQRPGA